MKEKDKTSYIEKIANFTDNLTFADLPQSVIENTKNQILGMLGAIFSGLNCEYKKNILAAGKIFKGEAGGGKVTLFPQGTKVPFNEALFVLSTLSMIYDYDDYLFAGHTGHSAVIPSLLLGEKLSLSGKDIILATVLANEVEGRLGASVLLGPQNGQLWSFIHLIGGIIVYSKLNNFSKDKIANALSLAFYQPPFANLSGFMGSPAKILTASYPLIQGIICVQLAQKGMRGCLTSIEDEKGFWNYFSYFPFKNFLAKWEGFLTNTLSFKIYPGCAYIDSVMDCVFDILKNENFNISPKEIYKIEVEGNFFSVKMNEMSKPYLKVKNENLTILNFTLPYNIAVGLMDKELTPTQFNYAHRNNPEVWKLGEKIIVHHNATYTRRMVENMPVSAFPLPSLKDDPVKLALFLKEINFENLFSKFTFFSGIRSGIELVTRNLFKSNQTLSEEFVKKFKMVLPASVKIKTTKGKSFYEFREIPYGSAGESDKERRKHCIEKFLLNAKPFIGIEKANQVCKEILNLEKKKPEDITKIIKFLCKK